MQSKIFICVLAASLFLLSGSVFAGDDYNVTVDVNVTSLTEITVVPASINWTDTPISVGQAGGLRYLDIKNTGTVNVTNIFSHTSTLDNETARPYGSTNPGIYSAGNVLVFRNQSTSTFWPAGKLEWNWTDVISNIVLTDIQADSRAAWGFYRNATSSFVWAVGNGTDVADDGVSHGCNSTGTVFAIEDENDAGTTGTRYPRITNIPIDSRDDSFAYFNINRATSFFYQGCVAVSTDCTKVYFYKFDKRAGFSGCDNSAFITAGPLAPDQIERVTADAWVPKGMPAGALKRVIWTFYAS